MNSLTFVVALIVLALPVQTQTLTAAEAKAHEGENGTVCGKVVGEKTAASSKGQPTFINVDSAYPNQVFTILVWGDDRKNVGDLPQVGSHVCATGLIKDYRGVPEIVVRNGGQLCSQIPPFAQACSVRRCQWPYSRGCSLTVTKMTHSDLRSAIH